MSGLHPMIPDRYRGVSGSDPGPVDGVLALLGVRLRRATLMGAGCSHIEDGLSSGALGDSDRAFAPQAGHGPRKIITGCRKR
jgi:hypothetical protein